MNVLLLQLDGVIPNLALMRIAAHHRMLGDEVTLRHDYTPRLGDAFDKVYGSLIFKSAKPYAQAALRQYPKAILGGTGWGDPERSWTTG